MLCRIRINGHLDPSWQEWFDHLEIVREKAGTTLLSGTLSDQAALYGVLLKIRNLGLILLSLDTDNQEKMGFPHDFLAQVRASALDGGTTISSE